MKFFDKYKHVNKKTTDIIRGDKNYFGKGVFLNDYVIIDSKNGGKIVIADGTHIGMFSVIRSAGHSLPLGKGHIPGDIIIGKNVWIGAHVVITKGVIIGDNSVIGAGSVVTKDIPSGVMVCGVPCVVKKELKDMKKFGKLELIDKDVYWRKCEMSETEMECIRELQSAFHDLDKRILRLEGMDYCRCGRRKAVDKIFCDKCLDKLYNEITKDNFK